jgi:hypothetical protein
MGSNDWLISLQYMLDASGLGWKPLAGSSYHSMDWTHLAHDRIRMLPCVFTVRVARIWFTIKSSGWLILSLYGLETRGHNCIQRLVRSFHSKDWTRLSLDRIPVAESCRYRIDMMTSSRIKMKYFCYITIFSLEDRFPLI